MEEIYSRKSLDAEEVSKSMFVEVEWLVRRPLTLPATVVRQTNIVILMSFFSSTVVNYIIAQYKVWETKIS